MSATTSPEIIEGSFRVIATAPVAARKSPNRRRAAARIFFWHTAMLVALVAVPLVF